MPRDKWTPAMHVVAEYTIDVCRELLDKPVTVSILADITQSYAACFDDLGFVFNLGRLGHAWFNAGVTDELNALIIHELGHHRVANHLDAAYHEELCRLGARFVKLVASNEVLRARNAGAR